MKRWNKVLSIIAGAFLIVTVVCGIKVMKNEPQESITIIGGADGPTSIFLAGNLDGGGVTFTVIGSISLVISSVLIVYVVRNRRNKE